MESVFTPMKIIQMTYNNSMRVFFGILFEYLLSFKTFLFNFLPKPKSWESGLKGTFVFIPGFMDTWGPFKKLGNELNKLGFRIIFLNNVNTFAPIEKMTEQSLEVLKSNSIQNFYIVGHSKGGLTTKYLLDNYPEINKKCIKAFTVSTPWNGTIFAKIKLMNFYQLVPNSKFLNNCSLVTKSCEKIINIYPKLDNSVVPNKYLLLKGVTNIKTNDVGHTNILNSKDLLKVIIENI